MSASILSVEHDFGSGNQLLRTLIDNLPDFIFIKDAQSRILISNLAHAETLGAARPDDVVGKTDFDFFTPELANQYFEDEQAVIKSGRPLNREETTLDHRTGKTRWLETTKTPLRDEEGKVIGLVGISRDITGHREAEQALAQAQNYLDAMLENVPDRVYFKDTQSRFVKYSKALAKRLNLDDPNQAIGKTDFDFQPRERAQEFYNDEQRIIQTGEPLINKTERQIMRDGAITWTSTTKIPFRDSKGNIIGLVGINRDITRRMQAEEELRQARDEQEQRVIERTAELSARNAELAQTNEALAIAHRQLQAMLDNIPDRIYFKDTQSRFLKCSKALAKRLGVENPDLMVGKTDFDFQPHEKAQEFYNDEQRIIRTGEPLINKIENQTRPDGEVIWASVTKVPLRDEKGNIVGLVGINRDITEQVQAEEVLHQARNELEQRVAERTRTNAILQQQIAERQRVEKNLAQERLLLRTLIDNLPDAIYAKDTACRKILLNPADLKNLRCNTMAEAIGKTDFDLFPKDMAAKFFADDQSVIQTGRPILNQEEFFINQDGRQCYLLTSKLPLRDQEDRIIGLMGIGRDITERKTAEQKLEDLHRELVTASRYAGMAEVATGVLHNVGNVLNSVNVSATLIADQLRHSKADGVTKLAKLLREHSKDLARFLTEDKRGRQVPVYLEELAERLNQERTKLQAELDGLTRNIEHIKEIVTMQQEHARMFGVVETLTLSDLIEDAMKLNSAGYVRHAVTVKREYDPLPPVPVDKHKVLQILVNLFSNAKYACDAGKTAEKRVTVRLKAAGKKRVRIEVEDNGVGIAPENLTRIFSQGFTTRKGGHGFGLHSGALAAKELGGSLTVHSDGLGHGATFNLELPLTPPGRKTDGHKPRTHTQIL